MRLPFLVLPYRHKANQLHQEKTLLWGKAMNSIKRSEQRTRETQCQGTSSKPSDQIMGGDGPPVSCHHRTDQRNRASEWLWTFCLYPEGFAPWKWPANEKCNLNDFFTTSSLISDMIISGLSFLFFDDLLSVYVDSLGTMILVYLWFWWVAIFFFFSYFLLYFLLSFCFIIL